MQTHLASEHGFGHLVMKEKESHAFVEAKEPGCPNHLTGMTLQKRVQTQHQECAGSR